MNESKEGDALDGGDGAKSWLANQYTQKSLRVYREKLRAAEVQLVQRCSQSSDPAVREAFALVNQLKIDVHYFGGKP
jgi:hypothetical protein